MKRANVLIPEYYAQMSNLTMVAQIIHGDVRHVRHIAYLANEEFIGSFQSFCLLISEDEGDLHVGGDHVGDWVRRRVGDLVVREERALRRLQ